MGRGNRDDKHKTSIHGHGLLTVLSKAPPVERGGRALQHRRQTARRFPPLPGYCMAARYPAISFGRARIAARQETYGRKKTTTYGRGLTADGEVC